MAIEKFNKFMFIGNFVLLLLNVVLLAATMGGFF